METLSPIELNAINECKLFLHGTKSYDEANRAFSAACAFSEWLPSLYNLFCQCEPPKDWKTDSKKKERAAAYGALLKVLEEVENISNKGEFVDKSKVDTIVGSLTKTTGGPKHTPFTPVKKRGHFFVMKSDIRYLLCDAWLIPTAGGFHAVNRHWVPNAYQYRHWGEAPNVLPGRKFVRRVSDWPPSEHQVSKTVFILFVCLLVATNILVAIALRL